MRRGGDRYLHVGRKEGRWEGGRRGMMGVGEMGGRREREREKEEGKNGGGGREEEGAEPEVFL